VASDADAVGEPRPKAGPAENTCERAVWVLGAAAVVAPGGWTPFTQVRAPPQGMNRSALTGHDARGSEYSSSRSLHSDSALTAPGATLDSRRLPARGLTDTGGSPADGGRYPRVGCR
jgi:hypothetical protein